MNEKQHQIVFKAERGRDGGEGEGRNGQSSESSSDDHVGPSFCVSRVGRENGHATVSHPNHHQMTAACMDRTPCSVYVYPNVPVPQLHMSFVVDN